MSTLELHLGQLLLYILSNGEELGVLALHGTLTSGLMELLEAFVVVALLASLTLDGIHKDGLTKTTEKRWFDLVSGEAVCRVEHETDVTGFSSDTRNGSTRHIDL